MKKKSGLAGLKNIGPTIEKRLNEIGIKNKSDLEKVGAAKAHRMIRDRNPGKTMPVCYYLYSLQGALMGRHWNDLPEKTKEQLLKQVR
ncbi:MAG: TfoX/Sxy family protein [Nitrososphaera sp.]|uniref:TfoX/Sxy family protein n=1 Tax=Nitrososphaera sp. TaxID=1971748 RepID=UPI003D700351